jgi:asparagine synthase (glutamine-hydrolysing)
MCGIAGFIGPGDQGDLHRMTRALAHRGPDGEGFQIFADQGVHMGHRRLSIIDVTDGAQPMANEDGTVWVIFNGEIYNHAELRRELIEKGHRFSTDHSDTEVLVHGWEQWGTDLPEKLNGMFAFAIWDKAKNTLFLARDRFGEKPLYWGKQGELFLFASELSAFTEHSAFTPRLNKLALKKYFAHGFVPSPNAFYQDTQKLRPGCWLKLEAGKVPNIQPYWQFQVEPNPKPPSLDEAAEEVRALLVQSVGRRLMSDVPLGVFLSGGIDSSSAAAAMCQFRSPKDVKSFCIGFNETSFDESVHARQMAAGLGCHHHEDVLDISAAKNLMDEILGQLDEPLADASILPTYLLSRFARKNVTVALSGDGGDELFAGYDTFKALRPATLYNAVMPRFAHKGVRTLANLLPKSAANMSLDFKIRRALQGLDYGPELWNPVWIAPLEVSDLEDLFQEPTDVEELYSEVLAQWHRSDDLSLIDRALEFYSNFYLPDGVLTKVDRASMMNGLETRSVFLDNDLVEFARTLPATYKFDGTTRKLVLKKAVQGLVPDKVITRAKKGFGVPMLAWLKDMDIQTEGADVFAMNPSGVVRRSRNHLSGREDHRLFLWAWTVLQHHQGLGGAVQR